MKIKGQIKLYNSKKELITKEKLTNMTYNKEKIIEISKEKFNDDDPCIIHETYCVNILALDLIGQIENNKDYEYIVNNIVDLENIPNEIHTLLNISNYKDVKYLEIN